MFKFRELLEAKKGELAEIITSEHGKVISDAMGEITRGQEVVEFACGMPEMLKGEYSENASTNVDEFMAEAFTEYRLSSNPSKYATLVGQLIDKYFKK
jgi:acyl-CoA reductase-like NAD-dependent aldehyde dehydrogenase